MIAVIFRMAQAGAERRNLDLACEMRRLLETIDGFIADERIESLDRERARSLSLSFFATKRRSRHGGFPESQDQAEGVARIFDN